jgi:RNA polymerase sigma-70 factor (ECF subfamily)
VINPAKNNEMTRQNLLFFRSKKKAEGLDDLEIIRICLTEDPEVFEKIVEKYRDQVFWTAYNLVLDYEDARDISQQSFVKLWNSLPEFKPEKSLSGWIGKITVNCAIDFLRSRKTADPLPELPTAEWNPGQELDLKKIFARVAPLLPERQRVVLVLREINGWDFPDIAQSLHCTESTVRNLLSQAKQSFRQKIKELFPEYGM